MTAPTYEVRWTRLLIDRLRPTLEPMARDGYAGIGRGLLVVVPGGDVVADGREPGETEVRMRYLPLDRLRGMGPAFPTDLIALVAGYDPLIEMPVCVAVASDYGRYYRVPFTDGAAWATA